MAKSSAELIEILTGVDASTYDDTAQRAEVADALLSALRRVQTPWDIAFEHGWIQPALLTAIKTLCDVGLWQKWTAAGGHTASVTELSQLTGIDATLLGRLLRSVAAEKYLLEVDVETYALTPFTKVLGDDNVSSVYNYIFHTNLPVFQHFPKFAAESGYKNPLDAAHGNFQSFAGEDQNLFKFYGAHPEYAKDFSNVMSLNANSKTPWFKVFPSSNIINGSKPDRALVVDVGGGFGHDLKRFYAENPDVPNGSLVLQDLPNVIESADVAPPLVAQSHDFFQPQPVVGARVYYLHFVLHDWPEPEAIKILKNLAAVMERGYSKILLYELVIQAKGGHRYESASDLTMMFAVSAAERTELVWKDLVKKAGLAVTKIWTSPESLQSIIEIELP